MRRIERRECIPDDLGSAKWSEICGESAYASKAKAENAQFRNGKALDDRGQMMVELCAVLPVAIIIGMIAVNVLMFFGDCAEFDRLARNAIRTFATSPAYHQTREDSTRLIEERIEEGFDVQNIECEVTVSSDQTGLDTYTAVIVFKPTLFGMRLRDEIFGVPLPSMAHQVSLSVDTYKPGILF